ncbi:MAG: NUDIX domain-containing protein [Candidatus Paceibacterota bacterium]
MERVLTQTFGVVGAIIEKEGEFLLVKETEAGPDQGKWNHPAGWIDVGESPLEAVKREVQEETGYSFSPEGLLGIYSLMRNDIENDKGEYPHAIKLIFTGSISSEPVSVLAGDVSKIEWFSAEEIYEMRPEVLRDIDIKFMIKDHFSGKGFSLDVVVHTDSKILRDPFI